MKFKRAVFLLAILGILLLIILSQNILKIEKTKISKIYFSESKTTIITDSNQTLILFESKPTGLKEGDFIEFSGSKDSYKGKEQSIIDKIWKIN